jgi:DNA-binding LacI/PurR family transcriptional regulator
MVDNEKAGRLAAEYLYERGYRRPCFVGESAQYSFAVPASEQRYKGFSDYFKSKGIELSSESVWLGPYSEEAIDKKGVALFSSPDRPDCMVGSGDMIALRLVKQVLERSGKIPERLAVLGFGNLDVSEYFSLSTVEQYLAESGRLAAELVIDRLKAPDRIPRQILMPLTIIERGTVKDMSPGEKR